jgi:hypothetical protein
MIFGPRGEMRVAPKLPAHAMRTYALDQPLATHYRVASCAEVECPAWAHGWRMGYDLTDPAKVEAANLIRNKSGRAFTFEVVGTVVTFTFPPGQQCFRVHRVPLEREPLMVVRGGDWRGNPRRERHVHTSAESFVDEWATDLDKLNTERERG